jgi:hypothetical protein
MGSCRLHLYLAFAAELIKSFAPCPIKIEQLQVLPSLRAVTKLSQDIFPYPFDI